MNSIKKNNHGFGTLEVILILIIIILIATVGWFVYNKKAATKAPSSTTISSQIDTNKATQTNPTADWVAYTSDAGRFSLKYPKNWVIATHPDLCTAGIFLVAPSADSVGACGSSYSGQIAFVGITGDGSHLCYNLDASTYTNITKSTLTISGITLTKQSGTTINDTGGEGSVPNGSFVEDYCYGNQTYGFNARYIQTPSNIDVLKDFDTIVTKTLTISH